ncbi:hypothetical protein M8C21_018608, partial [Ambrosia artemisiifolia]
SNRLTSATKQNKPSSPLSLAVAAPFTVDHHHPTDAPPLPPPHLPPPHHLLHRHTPKNLIPSSSSSSHMETITFPFTFPHNPSQIIPLPTLFRAYAIDTGNEIGTNNDDEVIVWEVKGGKRTKLVGDNVLDMFVVPSVRWAWWDLQSGSKEDSSTTVSLGNVVPTMWVQCRELFMRLMLPEGYPESVTSDYMEYSCWRGVQGVAAQVSGVLATQSLLYAVGLGKGAIPTAAAVNWVLKDGIGYLSKIFLSKFGRHFDVNPKGWRLFADFMENAAFGMEILTPAFPHLFVPIGAAAGAGRSAATLIQAATRSCFFAGFAAQRNFAESFVGLVPSVKEVNDEEPFFPALPLLSLKPASKVEHNLLSPEAKEAAAIIDQRLELGSKLSEIVKTKTDAHALLDLYKNQGYILTEQNGKFCVILKDTCSPQDMLKSMFHVSYLYWLEKNVGLKPVSIYDDCRPGGMLQISLEYVEREFNHAKHDGELAGIGEIEKVFVSVNVVTCEDAPLASCS